MEPELIGIVSPELVPGIGVGDEAHRARAAVGDLDRLEMAALVVIKRRGVLADPET